MPDAAPGAAEPVSLKAEEEAAAGPQAAEADKEAAPVVKKEQAEVVEIELAAAPVEAKEEQTQPAQAQEPILELTAELVVACGTSLGESPIWDERRQLLLWIDITDSRFWQLDPAETEEEKRVKSWDVPAVPGSFCLTESGEYIFAFHDGFSFYDPETSRRIPITEDFEPERNTRLNDGRVDRQGRYVAGGYNNKGPDKISDVYRLNTDFSVERLFAGVRCANSICFAPSPTGPMYFIDTPATASGEAEILAFPDYANSGMSGEAKVFAKVPGKPDGSIVDSEGGLWNAVPGAGRVVRYRPDGSVSAVVSVPVPYPTCATLGGPDLRTLYITDASPSKLSPEQAEQLGKLPGGLFQVRVPVPGLPEERFKSSSADFLALKGSAAPQV